MHKNMKVEMPMVHAKIAREPTTCTPNCWPVLQASLVLG
jgi:hypothetical protein